jgi:phosphate-selective porin OprO/OprP
LRRSAVVAFFGLCFLPLTSAAQTRETAGGLSLKFGLLLQEDGRFSVDEPSPVADQFTLRKARPTLTGRVARRIEFKIMPDFGGGEAQVMDAYVDVRLSRAFRLRAGKDKVPVGHEWLQVDASTAFPERALPNGLVSHRDVGVQAIGTAGERVSYAAGLFRDDAAGRLTVKLRRGVGAHLGAARSLDDAALTPLRTSVQQRYFAYGPGVAAGGPQTRLAPAVFFYRGSFGAFGEYVHAAQTVTRGSTRHEVATGAWDVTGSYVITGEPASDRGVRPAHRFDPAHHHWGALQLVARYAALAVDRAAFDAGVAAAGASRSADQVSVGANWYPTAFLKWYGTFEHVEFDAASQRPAENVVVVRFQVAF